MYSDPLGATGAGGDLKLIEPPPKSMTSFPKVKTFLETEYSYLFRKTPLTETWKEVLSVKETSWIESLFVVAMPLMSPEDLKT